MRMLGLPPGNFNQHHFFCQMPWKCFCACIALTMVLSDICNLFISIGVFCMPLYIPYALTGTWHLGKGLCKLWLLLDYLMCSASVFNIVLISYDRFLSVTKAVRTFLIFFMYFEIFWKTQYSQIARKLSQPSLLYYYCTGETLMLQYTVVGA